MALFKWRDRAIFRVTAAPLDADEIRLRFRKRVVRLSFLIGIAILAFPILKEKRAIFQTDREVRRVERAVIDARMRAAELRHPTGLELIGRDSWQVTEYPGADTCDASFAGQVKLEKIEQSEITWRPLFLDKGDTSGIGSDISRFCFHPVLGVLVDSKALDLGWIYLLVAPKDEALANNKDYIRQLVISNSGSEISISKPN